MTLTGGSGNERRGKQRRSRAGIRGAVGRVRAEDSDGESFNCGVKRAEAGTHAGLARASEHPAETAIRICAGRIDEAYARREIFVARRRQRAWDSGIGWEENSCGRGWKTTDCFPGSKVAT